MVCTFALLDYAVIRLGNDSSESFLLAFPIALVVESFNLWHLLTISFLINENCTKKEKRKKKCKGDTMASWFKDEDQKKQLVYDGTHLTQVKLTMVTKC